MTTPATKSSRPARRILRTSEKLAKALRAARDDIARIEANAKLSLEYRRELVDERRQQLLDAVDAIEADAKGWLGKAQARPNRKLPTDPAEATLREAKLGRAWERIQRQLDAGADAAEVAREYAAQGDRLALDAMREELPSYLSAKGESPESLKAYAMHIDDAEVPLLSEAEVEHYENADAANRAAQLLQTNLGIVRKEATGGESVPLLIGETHDGQDANIDLAVQV